MSYENIIKLVVAAVFYVLSALGNMQCMKKAGEAGWKAWIPFYNTYLMYKIVGMKGGLVSLHIIDFCVSVISTVFVLVFYISIMNYGVDELYSTSYSFFSGVLLIIALLKIALGIAILVISILFAINISKSFGLGGGYIAGMILVPDIFILIIGFGKSEYKGSYVPKGKEAIQ